MSEKIKPVPLVIIRVLLPWSLQAPARQVVGWTSIELNATPLDSIEFELHSVKKYN